MPMPSSDAHADDPMKCPADECKPDPDLYVQSNARVSRWEEPTKRETRRKKGWQPAHLKSFTPQCFSYFPREYTQHEIEVWIRRHRIDDLQKRIAVQDFEANDPDIRSQSPEPIYDAKTGLRSNTREQRHRDRYIKERLRLIDEVLSLDESYVPPPDYKPPKKQKKIYIPDPDNPAVNIIGQIIGPSGTTQQKLEKESKCKISIRGKGSQSRVFNPDERDDEPLHVLLTADKNEDLEKGVAIIDSIINQTDESKKLQLIVFNQTGGGMRKVWCESCGKQGHKFYECPEKLMQTNADVWCEICNSGTHPTNDCPKKNSREDHRSKEQKQNRQPFGALAIEDNPDEELHQFLKEVKSGKSAKPQGQLEGSAPLQAITFTKDEVAQSSGGIAVIPADEEEAQKLQASIALYNAQQNEDDPEDELKTSLLKQQLQSLQATQHAEVTTSKAFRSYKDGPQSPQAQQKSPQQAAQAEQADLEPHQNPESTPNEKSNPEPVVEQQPAAQATQQEPGLYDAYWQQMYMMQQQQQQMMYQQQFAPPQQYYYQQQQQQYFYPTQQHQQFMMPPMHPGQFQQQPGQYHQYQEQQQQQPYPDEQNQAPK